MEDVPAALKANKAVAPFISRANELDSAEPIVAYHARLYVLDHILSNKLHASDKDIEAYTIGLLDATENAKNTDDEAISRVLNDRQLLLNYMTVFAYRLFNSCLHDIDSYNGAKGPLASKLQATTNFLTLLSVFTNSDANVDFAKLTGGKTTDAASFAELNKEKIKTLKYQLSQLLKGKITAKQTDDVKEDDADYKELEDELERGIDTANVPEEGVQEDSVGENAPQDETPGESFDAETKPLDSKESADGDPVFSLPSAPADLDLSLPPFVDEDPSETNGDFKLPGAPHFLPEDSPDNDDSVKLPGAPKFLPDDDLSHINKSSPIHFFAAGKGEKKAPPAPAQAPSKPPPAHAHKPVTKEELSSILDKTDLIAQIQKHAKFAISALNYEDTATAEAELVKSLELLRLLR